MTVVKPTLLDIEQMQQVVKEDVLKGNILYRSDDELATNIRSYTVVKDKDKILGYSALHIHTKTLAEIRSFVVDKDFRGRGIGTIIVKELLKEAKELKVEKVFTLTFQKGFFEKLDFIEVPKESLPEQKIWADCIKCKHFPVCDEVSLIFNL